MVQISLRGATKTYSAGDSVSHALDGVSLDIQSSKITAVVGPSGCGKSTLLNAIGLLIPLDSGSISVDGVDVGNSKFGRDARRRSALFSYVVQDFALLESETVAGNVVLPLVYGEKRIGRRRRRSIVSESLSKVGLSGFETKSVSRLSGGERQRVAIARAIAGYADVVLADEPTGALDSVNSMAVFEVLRSISKSGKTVVMATHNRELAALCDQIVEMKDGSILSSI